MRAAVRLLVAVSALAVILPSGHGRVSGAGKWDPIDPGELSSTTPVVQKDADAEALAWDVSLEDDPEPGRIESIWSHHLRIKIYTDRGRDQQSRVDIPVAGFGRVDRIEGRSIRRDGSFTEIKKSDVFERSLIKGRGFDVKATSFALPAVETGGIVEYRWRETYPGRLARTIRLPLSRSIPVQRVTYRVLPVQFDSFTSMRARPFHTNDTLRVNREQEGTTIVMRNVPADIEEPEAPPAWDVRPWMLLYHSSQISPTVPDRFWLDYSREEVTGWKDTTKVTPDIQLAADSLALGDAPLDRKLSALLALCRTKIKRIDVDTATAEDRKDFDFGKPAAAALTTGRGTGTDVMGVFIALCRAAGLDARVARLPSRNDVTFVAAWMLPELLADTVVAVRDGAGWRFLDPTNDHAPDGHLLWTQELVPAIIADEHTLIAATTPMAPPEWTLRSAAATLHLSEDGTLEGDVTEEYRGHTGTFLKEQEDHVAPAERETLLKQQMAKRLPGAELTDVHIEHVMDPDKPYTRRYHLKVPGYAQHTGSRLFLQPAVLQKGIPPEFPAGERRHPIFFVNAWKEVDTVRIELPAGYRLESPGAPPPTTLAPFGAHSMRLASTADQRWIEMKREFYFGGGNKLQFPVQGYPVLKLFFDTAAKADAHTLALKKAAGAGDRP